MRCIKVVEFTHGLNDAVPTFQLPILYYEELSNLGHELVPCLGVDLSGILASALRDVM